MYDTPEPYYFTHVCFDWFLPCPACWIPHSLINFYAWNVFYSDIPDNRVGGPKSIACVYNYGICSIHAPARCKIVIVQTLIHTILAPIPGINRLICGGTEINQLGLIDCHRCWVVFCLVIIPIRDYGNTWLWNSYNPCCVYTAIFIRAYVRYIVDAWMSPCKRQRRCVISKCGNSVWHYVPIIRCHDLIGYNTECICGTHILSRSWVNRREWDDVWRSDDHHVHRDIHHSLIRIITVYVDRCIVSTFVQVCCIKEYRDIVRRVRWNRDLCFVKLNKRYFSEYPWIFCTRDDHWISISTQIAAIICYTFLFEREPSIAIGICSDVSVAISSGDF